MTFADGWFLAFFFMMVAGPTAMILEALWSKAWENSVSSMRKRMFER